MALQEVKQDKKEQRMRGELPDEILLSVIARLSWDEICRLSCSWKRLCEGWTLHQMFFKEYSRFRFRKPIGLFHGFLRSLPSMSMLEGGDNGLKLTFSVIAGDGDRQPHNLLISKFKDVPIARDNALGWLMQKANYEPNYEQKSIISCRAVGCLVLLAYSKPYNDASFKRFFCKIQNFASSGVIKSPPQRSGWIVMNPSNGTARKIDFPSHSSHIGNSPHLQHSMAFLNGIFQDEGSHYQILTSFYYWGQNGNCIYMDNLPSDEDLGDPDLHHRGAYYNDFYLYKSTTMSWMKFLGSNIYHHVMLHDAVIYRGVIHAMLSSKYNKLSDGVKYVEEISGRTRWMPLSIPLPRDNLFAAHLFVFQGRLMLAAAESSWTRGSTGLAQHECFLESLRNSRCLQDVRFACIWKLHEETRSWVEVSRMPDHIFYDIRNRSCCLNFWQSIRFCSSGGYVMVGGGCELDPVYPGSEIYPQCMVVCNIVTNHWQLAHVQPQVAAPVINQTLTLFEPRFDILA